MVTNVYKKNINKESKTSRYISMAFYDIYFLKKRALIKNYHFLPVIKFLNF